MQQYSPLVQLGEEIKLGEFNTEMMLDMSRQIITEQQESVMKFQTIQMEQQA